MLDLKVNAVRPRGPDGQKVRSADPVKGTRRAAPKQIPRTGTTPMTTIAHPSVQTGGMTSEEKFVIFASSLGTIFEWYDFFLYAVLGPFFAALFFPSGNA